MSPAQTMTGRPPGNGTNRFLNSIPVKQVVGIELRRRFVPFSRGGSSAAAYLGQSSCALPMPRLRDIAIDLE